MSLPSPLMSRIKIHPFLDYTLEEKTALVEKLHAQRLAGIEQDKIKRGRSTRSATKNRKKRKAKPKMSIKALEKALTKMPPEIIASLLEIHS